MKDVRSWGPDKVKYSSKYMENMSNIENLLRPFIFSTFWSNIVNLYSRKLNI